MKNLWGALGTGLFWLLWPFWFVYFRVSNQRARVLVVYNDELLVLKGWLSVKKYGMPGGGVKKHEKPLQAAVRELAEETGIEVPESSLTSLGWRNHNKYGLRYHAKFFCLQCPEKPTLRLRRPEIFAAAWIPLDEIQNYQLDGDLIVALRRYQPPEQATLL